MLCSLLQTPYFPRIEGGILFVEDVGEPPFRIERLLYQLHLSGVLGRQRALMLGDFTQCRPAAYDNGYDLGDAFRPDSPCGRDPGALAACRSAMSRTSSPCRLACRPGCAWSAGGRAWISAAIRTCGRRMSRR